MIAQLKNDLANSKLAGRQILERLILRDEQLQQEKKNGGILKKQLSQLQDKLRYVKTNHAVALSETAKEKENLRSMLSREKKKNGILQEKLRNASVAQKSYADAAALARRETSVNSTRAEAREDVSKELTSRLSERCQIFEARLGQAESARIRAENEYREIIGALRERLSTAEADSRAKQLALHQEAQALASFVEWVEELKMVRHTASCLLALLLLCNPPFRVPIPKTSAISHLYCIYTALLLVCTLLLCHFTSVLHFATPLLFPLL